MNRSTVSQEGTVEPEAARSKVAFEILPPTASDIWL